MCHSPTQYLTGADTTPYLGVRAPINTMSYYTRQQSYGGSLDRRKNTTRDNQIFFPGDLPLCSANTMRNSAAALFRHITCAGVVVIVSREYTWPAARLARHCVRMVMTGGRHEPLPCTVRYVNNHRLSMRVRRGNTNEDDIAPRARPCVTTNEIR